jgi:hypothetical protein
MSQIETIVKKDSTFLREHGLMDYSLLLVIESIKFPVSQSTRNIFASETQVHHIGIIDFLQDWSFSKKVEALWKGGKHNPKDISAIEPKKYQERFCKFVSQ